MEYHRIYMGDPRSPEVGDIAQKFDGGSWRNAFIITDSATLDDAVGACKSDPDRWRIVSRMRNVLLGGHDAGCSHEDCPA